MNLNLKDHVTQQGILRPVWLRVLCIVVGAVLLADALVLMAYGMFNVGVMVPAAIGALLLSIVIWRRWVARKLAAHPRLRKCWRWAWVLFGLWLASLLFFWMRLAQQSNAQEAHAPTDAIIVLGSATRDGQPSQALAYRLDVAAALAKTQPQALIVTSGGVDFGQTESEGRVMARYLMERHGIAPERLIMEEQSTSTALNLSLSSALLNERQVPVDSNIAVVTSDFHTLRAHGIARKAGMVNVHVVGASTPLSIRFNAWLREYFAVASSWLLGEF